MKKILSLSSAVILSGLFNFGLFIVAYNKLATPYLHESQRVDNAEQIIFILFPSFLILSLVSISLTYILTRKLT